MAGENVIQVIGFKDFQEIGTTAQSRVKKIIYALQFQTVGQLTGPVLETDMGTITCAAGSQARTAKHDMQYELDAGGVWQIATGEGEET